MSLWLDKLQKCWFVTRLVDHNLFLKNSSLNCANRCDPQISATELRLEFRSIRYSTIKNTTQVNLENLIVI